jgi:[ribosomal protein S5]-alanine N-acetyltransferase
MPTIFETARLIVRDWIPDEDSEQAFEIYGDPEVMRFIGNGETVDSIESLRQRLQQVCDRYTQLNNGTGYWAIVEKETGKIAGSVILKQLPDNEGQPTSDYEVGWHLRRDSWGKGYATEAGRAAVKYGFNILKLPTIYAVVKPANQASIRVTQRLGMTPMGRTNKYYSTELELFKLEAKQWRDRVEIENS